tara:strand:+ start:60 stop:587 length:528 start_codon:yes stop_codon:yes gene_type:complete
MKNMKVLALDVDGVMTNGTKLYDSDYTTIAKQYNDKDFTAIKLFDKLGVYVCFISSDKNINEKMARKRGVDFYYSRMEDSSINKVKFIDVLQEKGQHKYHGPNCEIYYAGDDFYDLDIMMNIPKNNRICPNDAPEYVKRMCSIVCDTNGGNGVVSEILTRYLEATNKFNEIYDLI